MYTYQIGHVCASRGVWAQIDLSHIVRAYAKKKMTKPENVFADIFSDTPPPELCMPGPSGS